MAIFGDTKQVPPDLSESGSAHLYILVAPDQINRLQYLVEAANPLFKPGQRISILELLYAALWRCVDKGSHCSRLTIVESGIANACFDSGPGDKYRTASPAIYTVTSTAVYLASASLVSIAQGIRCCMSAASDDFPYEGWLIDSLVGSGAACDVQVKASDLVLSSLPLPYLQGLLLDRGQIATVADVRHSSSARCAPRRIGCINMSERFASGRDGVVDTAAACSRPVSRQRELISIDLHVPVADIDCLWSRCVYSANPDSTRYGFLCDEFFEN